FPWYSLFPPFGGCPIGREPPETHRCVNFHFLSARESNNSRTACLIVIFALRMLLARPSKITRILGHGRVGYCDILALLRKKFLNLPNVVSESGFHRRGHSQGAVYSAEIIPAEVQRQHSVEFLPFLRERIGQAGESPHLHSHREIRPLDVRCADVLGVWIPVDRDFLAARTLGGGVPRFVLRV